MSDANNVQPRQTDGWLEPGKTNIQLIYILYLVGFVVGLTALIGIVIAYMNRGKAGGWVETHYTWAIRTFWIAVLFSLVSVLLMIVGIGFVLMIAGGNLGDRALHHRSAGGGPQRAGQEPGKLDDLTGC